MALRLCRIFAVGNKISTPVLRSAFVRASSHGEATPLPDPHKDKVGSDTAEMPDLMGQAVGEQRWELLARLAGNDDPFELNVKKRASGTFNDPTLIPSMFEKRLIGCICEEDAVSINWMFLYKGEPKRCECGNWFKLVELDPAKYGSQH